MTVGGGARVWERLGFVVEDRGFLAGQVEVVVDGGRPCVWGLRHAQGPRDALDLDGLPTAVDGPLPEPAPSPTHRNGVTSLDHVVIATPSLDRTTDALAAAGLAVRRQRDAGTLRQRFLRLGEVVLEIVGPPEPAGEGPARIWGLAFTTADLDGAVAGARAAGVAIGDPHAAVQPGRRIAGVRREAGLPLPVALLSPGS